MRRITRRIGLFGPGAVVKATGAGVRKRPTVPGGPAPPIEHERSEFAAPPPEKKSWLSRLLFGKDDG
ncbi:MAG TPA: hypothetical protein VGK26_05600 [Thermoanaerobaculia bacterium]|jgi:hypothetical protein